MKISIGEKLWFETKQGNEDGNSKRIKNEKKDLQE